MRSLITWVIGEHIFEAGIATTIAELHDTFALRYIGYVEGNKTVSVLDLRPGDAEKGWERDKYDTKDAIYLLAKHNNKTVGTARILLCDKSYILQDSTFNDRAFVFPNRYPKTEEVVTPQNTVESTRWVAIPVVVNSQQILISFLITAATMEAAKVLGRKYIICDINAIQHDVLERNGWKSEPLIKGFVYRGKFKLKVVIYKVDSYPVPKFASQLI